MILDKELAMKFISWVVPFFVAFSLLMTTAVHAQNVARYDNVAELTEKLNRLAKAGDYIGFFLAVNATNGQMAMAKGMATTMQNVFGQGGVKYSVLFERKGVEGSLLVGALWKDTNYLFVGSIIHYRNGEIIPLQTSIVVDFKKMAPYL